MNPQEIMIVPPPTFAPSPIAPPPPPAPRFKWLLPLIVIIILILVGAGGAYAYFVKPELWQKLFQREPDPTTVITRSFEALKKVKTSAVKVVFEAQTENITQPTLETYGYGGPTKIKFNANIQSGVESPEQLLESKTAGQFSLNVAMGTSTNWTFGLENRLVDQTLYLKLVQVPEFPFFDLNPWLNQWISLPIKEAMAQNRTEIDWTDPAKRQEMLQLITTNNPLILTSLGQTTLGTRNTYHYRVGLDQVKLKNLINATIKINDKNWPEAEPSEPLTDEDFEKVFKEFQQTTTELWIDKTDFLPYQLVVKATTQPTTSHESLFGVGQGQLTITVESYNQPLNIIAPLESLTVEEMMAKMFGLVTATSSNRMTSSANQRAASAAVMADLASLRPTAEIFANPTGLGSVSYAGFCESKEAKDLFDDITKAGGKNSVCNVTNNGQSYAISVKLPDNRIWCVDSTGLMIEIKESLAVGSIKCLK